MRIIKIEKENVSNGPGIRTVVWVSGCDHHCRFCHNPETWNYELGNELSNDIITEIINATDHPYISGITFTGGDPLSKSNRDDTIALAKVLRNRFSNKKLDFWVWTGHTFEEISMIPGIDVFDVIVDGKFEIDKKDLTLPWRGSSNQRIIDVGRSLHSNRIVEIN